MKNKSNRLADREIYIKTDTDTDIYIYTKHTDRTQTDKPMINDKIRHKYQQPWKQAKKETDIQTGEQAERKIDIYIYIYNL